ncbi:MAG: OmpA family protein [Desulfobulbaceae bacterium]|nr:OmpA family protein [Candidatus Kapabacteria bacterium]MBS4000355.1 OmpA family protein [Desulfobulbaceae bacterium]
MKRFFQMLLLVAFVFTSRTFSQEKEIPFNIGIFGGLNFNMHSPDLTGVSVDPPFVPIRYKDNQTSLGGHFGLIANIPVNHMFIITGRLGYHMAGGEIVDSASVNTLTSSINYVEFTPGVQIHNLISGSGLYLLGGLEFGIPMSPSFSVDFDDGVNPQPNIVNDAEITDAATRIALALGVGWMFEVSDNIFLTPEISYRLPFTEVSSDETYQTWEVPQLRLGLALTFGLSKQPDNVYEEEDDKFFNVGMNTVKGIDRQGNKSDLRKISVEETQYTELFPLLPYVFFNENSDVPDPKTQTLAGTRESGNFSTETLEPDALKINSSTLDIVGSRMKKDKNASIKLVGTIDNVNEKAGTGLAQRRAEFVKNYLVTNYGIEANRITVETTGLPSRPSSSRDPEGVQENRRVEIYPINTNSTLLDPIIIESDRQRIAEPTIVEFSPKVESSSEIGGWELEVKQAGRIIKRLSGQGKVEDIQWGIMPNELAASEIPVDYTYHVWDNQDNKKSISGSIPVEYFSITRKKSEERPDRTISKYSLVVFGFDSPEVSESDKRIVMNNIVPNIKFNSTVQIYGYTDRIGDEKYNKELAGKRAESVLKLLQSKVRDAKYEKYEVGESVLVYDNNKTAGRQLSRTVQIYVITPKN